MSAAWTLWKSMSTCRALTSRKRRHHLQSQKGQRPLGQPLPGGKRRRENPTPRTSKRRKRKSLRQRRRLPQGRRKTQHRRNPPQGAVARRKLWYANHALLPIPRSRSLSSQEESEDEDEITEIEPPKKRGRTAALRYDPSFHLPEAPIWLLVRHLNIIFFQSTGNDHEEGTG